MRPTPEGLRRRLAATRDIWRPGSVGTDPAAAAAPRDWTAPRGHVDSPGDRSTVESGLLSIRGWALFGGLPPSKVEGWLDEEPLGTASLGVLRPDLRDLTGLASSLIAGFELLVDLPESGSDRDVTLRMRATGPEGQRFHLDPVTVHVEAGRPEPPVPPASEPVLPWPRRSRRSSSGPLRVLVFTHQLDLGGAQLYLLDLLRGIRALGGVDLTVVSPSDGPVRQMLAELGIPVHLTAPLPIDDPVLYGARVEELAGWAAHGDFAVILVNTAVAFAGGEVALRLGIPCAWAIHESHDPAMQWWMAFGPTLHPEVRDRARAALAGAAAAVFEADATLEQYRPHLPAGPCIKADYGLVLDELDAARARFDPALARRRGDIPSDALVVLCVGMIEPRKAQSSLVQAFGMVAERHPLARLVLIGARQDQHTDALEEYIAACAPPGRVELLPVLADVWSWYGLADLLVTCSNLESLPRSVLEAMAWETPVLATSVFGLPELIDHDHNGWLCPPRDIRGLAAALDAALSAGPQERRRIGAAGRELVLRRHALKPYAREIAGLLADVATAA